MDFLDQLRVFIRVAQSGGLGTVAEQIGMPRPTVSLAVQRLEARLGARLLNRTTRRVSLTPDGQALLQAFGNWVGEVLAPHFSVPSDSHA